MTHRRTFLTGAAAMSGIKLLPFRAAADGRGSDSFASANGDVIIAPKDHASVVMQTPVGTMYVDPVGDPDVYADMPAPDMILIMGDATMMVSNPGVFDKLSAEMQARTTSIANGESMMAGNVRIDAIPAYNITEERLNFHPQGRDNGYVVTVDGLRIYISGDTEDTSEMRALENIDIAFVCMNLPFTMDATSAACAVTEFAPRYVYPYHYRGRDNGTQDPAEFAEMLDGDIAVKLGNWYG